MVMQKSTARSSARASVVVLITAIVLAGIGSIGRAAAAAEKIHPAALGQTRTADSKRSDRSTTPIEPTHTASARHEPTSGQAADSYACHPTEDVACTIVRETADGTVIVTMHPAGTMAPVPTWSVVSGSPPGGSRAGGTIYVVPAVNAVTEASIGIGQPLMVTANGAPILE
jgi:hypothetical protein